MTTSDSQSFLGTQDTYEATHRREFSFMMFTYSLSIYLSIYLSISFVDTKKDVTLIS